MSGAQRNGDVVHLGDGGFVVVWTDESQTGGDTAGAAVRAQRFDAAGTAVGGEFLVNTTTAGDQFAPRVAVLTDGGFVVVWGGDDYSFRAQMFDASGAVLGSEIELAPAGALSPAIATAIDIAATPITRRANRATARSA